MKTLLPLLAFVLTSCEDDKETANTESNQADPPSRKQVSAQETSPEQPLSSRNGKPNSDKPTPPPLPEIHEPSTPRQSPPPTPGKTKYQVAKKVAGKPGYVINPATGTEVDARGVPPGSLVRDPNQRNSPPFRTP